MLTFIFLSLCCYGVLLMMAPPSTGRSRILGNAGDFGSGGGKPKVSTISDTYGDTRNKFLNYVSGTPYPNSNGDMGLIGKPGPVYSGQRTAPMSSQENTSLSKVDQYANQSPNSTIQAGKAQIEKTLNGNYDPSTSPYYQAVKAQSAANLDDTKRQIASDSAAGGRYFSGSRMKQQAEATNKSNMNLDTILGTLSENERQRQMSVLPQAMAFGQAEQNLPLQQATALQSIGALPRTLEQNTANSSVENFYKSQYDYPLSILQLLAGVQAPPTQSVTPRNSGLQNATQAATTGAMLAMMMCWVAEQVLGDGTRFNRKVDDVRYFLNFIAPKWFRNAYLKHGTDIAIFIQDKPLCKMALRPLFELFSFIGRTEREASYV